MQRLQAFKYELMPNGATQRQLRRLFAVPPHYTSQECPACHHVSAENRQAQARFACVECGYENHADHVGAINVLERGHRLLACGDGALRPSMKQEPTEGVKPSGLAPVGIPFL